MPGTPATDAAVIDRVLLGVHLVLVQDLGLKKCRGYPPGQIRRCEIVDDVIRPAGGLDATIIFPINDLEGGVLLRAMSLSLLKFVGQASLVDDAMLPS